MRTNYFQIGDCAELIEMLPEDSIDLVVTSPPYDDLRNYKGYIFDYKRIARGLLRAVKTGGIVVWVVGDKIDRGNRTLSSFRQALHFQKIGWNVYDDILYKKKNTPFIRLNAYTNCYEHMFVFSKGKPKTFNPLRVRNKRSGTRYMTISKNKDGCRAKGVIALNEEGKRKNIWEYAVGSGTTADKIAFNHPAVFPEKLAEDHILSWSNEGDIVLDPMCGSGTTCKMALLNNRRYIGFDISEEYIEAIAKPRLALCGRPAETASAASKRESLVSRINAGTHSISELCRIHGVSRPTAYKWIKRHSRGETLEDRSKAPLNRPNKTSPAVEAAILQAKEQHPDWGGRRLKAYLESSGKTGIPAASNIAAILRRNM